MNDTLDFFNPYVDRFALARQTLNILPHQAGRPASITEKMQLKAPSIAYLV